MHGVNGMTCLNAGALEISPRLVKAAHEFEAQMMKELLKPMTESGLSGDGDDQAASGGALREFASEAFGRALSERGGLGIGKNILHSFDRIDRSSSNLTASDGSAGNRKSVVSND